MIIDKLWPYEKSRNIYFRKIKSTNLSKAIVFVHGLGGTNEYWDKKYERLGKEYNLYFIDLLGFGYSKKPFFSFDALRQHVNALNKFILKNVDERDIVLVGHSAGAIISLAYLADYPLKIQSAFLLSLPYYHSKKEANKAINNTHSFSFIFRDTALSHLACLVVCGTRPILMRLIPLLVKKTHQKIAQRALLHTHSSYFSTLRHVIEEQNLPKLLREIDKKKVILIHGEDDKVAPVKNIIELKKRFNISLHILLHADHGLPYSNPNSTVAIIKKELGLKKAV